MLSISAIKDARQAKHYYAQADYYAKGDESDISSLWFGRGADGLGLAGAVETEVFRAILEGKLPDGTELGRVTAEGLVHRAGWDFTLSAPKSVSILALAGGDHRLLGAHHEAVAIAMGTLERDHAVARKMTNGVVREEVTGNLLVAQFTHSTSRAVDPQLHTHNVVANATAAADGKWRSLETRRMYEAAMTVGQIYRAELALRVRALGYEITVDARKGTFDIAAVPQAIIRAFSKRRAEIEQAVEKFGYRTAKGMDKAAVRTRSVKGTYRREELLRGWDNEMSARGFDPAGVIEAARTQGGAKTQVSSRSLQQDVEFAYRNLAEREAVFPRDQVLADALRVGLGQHSTGAVQAALDGLIADGTLIKAELDQGRGARAALTTPEAMRKEAYILSLMEKGEGELKPIAPERLVKAAIENRTLGGGQRQAVTHLLRSRDRVIGIQGFAGTGKTYALDTVREVAEKRGFALLGLAPTARAAQELEDGSGIKSQTLASHLMSLNNQRRLKPTPKAVWIVDEASLTNANDMADLLTFSRQTRSRVAVVGDRLQLGAIEYGKPFEQMQRAGLGVAVITEIRRQRNRHLLGAVESAIAGDIHTALGRIADDVRVIEDREARIKALIGDFVGLDPAARERALVLIPDNATRRQVNEGIREALQRRGELEPDQVCVEALASRGMTRQEKGRAELYAKGDVVLFQRDFPSLRVTKDKTYTVEDVQGKVVHLRGDDGLGVKWRPARVAGRSKNGVEVYEAESRQLAVGDQLRWRRNDKELGLRNSTVGQVVFLDGKEAIINFDRIGRRTINLESNLHWDYAFTATVHAAQGATVDRAFVHAESWRRNLVNRKSFYVSLSRARFEATIYTDDSAKLAVEVERRLGEKTSALETTDISHRALLDRHGIVVDVNEVMRSADSKGAIKKTSEKELGI